MFTDRDIDEAIAAFAADGEPNATFLPGGAEVPAPPSAAPRWIKPLSTAVTDLVDVLYNDDERFETGIIDIDVYTRGWRPKELVLCVGFSHSGKTQVALQIILNNPNKRVLFLSLDDAAELVVVKLAAMGYQLAGSELEREVREGNPEYVELLHNAPADRFPNLALVDGSVSIDDLPMIVNEAIEWWDGELPQLIIIDYLGLLGAKGGNIEDGYNAVSVKMKQIKAWCKSLPCPLFLMHQGTRSGARPGSPITLTSMAFGGEQEATQIIGLRRKKDDPERSATERNRWRNVITVDIPKNKRVGGRLTGPDGIDLFMEPSNGTIRSLYASDFDEQL